MPTVCILDYNRDSYAALTRKDSPRGKTLAERLGLSGYAIRQVRYHPVMPGVSGVDGINDQTPEDILGNALRIQPDYLVVEPLAVGWGGPEYSHFLDLIAESRQRTVVYTVAYRFRNPGRYLAPCRERGLATLPKGDYRGLADLINRELGQKDFNP